MRVLTFNIAGWKGARRPGHRDFLRRVAELVRGADADVVGLQEVIHPAAEQVRPEEELARLTGMHAAYVEAHQYRSYSLGNAVLCREPITETVTHELPHSWPERRVLLEVRGTSRGMPLAVFCTHLVHMSRALATLRRAQAAAVAERLRACALPHVLVGDLNAAPHARELAPLRNRSNGLEHLRGLRSWPAARPWLLYDHIWPGPGWEVCEIEVIPAHISDHRPLVARLDWRGHPHLARVVPER
jgi:endonuclease/exonuclease/phosphatase family metal-dependent hydrolase